jgi:hypothetical protein
MGMKLINVFLICFLSASFVMAEDKAADKKSDKKKTDDADPTILLESTFVGDKEQPAVSYFIPWKGSGTPDKLQWNMEDKHDQTLRVIDRDVLLNTMNIYNDMNLEAEAGTGTLPATATDAVK